jgi:hypothetical protein
VITGQPVNAADTARRALSGAVVSAPGGHPADRSAGAATAPSTATVPARAPASQLPPGERGRRRAGATLRGQLVEVALWAGLTVALASGSALLVASGVLYPGRHDGRFAAATLPLAWPPRLSGLTALAPALAAGALGTVALLTRRRADRPAPRFSPLVALAYAGTVAWWLLLGVASRRGVAAAPGLLAGADGHPRTLLRGAGGEPPGPLLLVWALARLGVRGGLPVGVALTVLGALVVPLLAVAVRSLCHEPAARRLLPVLVFTPWAPFAVASAPAVTAAVAAAAVAVGVVGCERGRRAWWAFSAGLLLGVAGLFAYPAIWLGVAIAAAYFVRRRPILNVISGVGALTPLFALRLAGYSWPKGMSQAGGGLFDHAALAWVVPDLLAVLLCCGPVLVRAARRMTMTPGWPFLVGAVAAALFALVDGLAVGGVQTSWLPFFGWLVVPALAPRPRPALPGDTSSAGELPYGLVGVGAAVAVALAALLAPAGSG